MKIRSLLPAALLIAGCTTMEQVPRSDLHEDAAFEKIRVATMDGFEYRFVRAEIVPDTLVGYFPVTVERTNARDEVWYEDVLRVHKIPLRRVAHVQTVRKDPVKTAFYGAGVAAAGYLLVTLVEEGRGEASKGPTGGVKGGIRFP